MKTILYVFMALLMSASFTSCTADSITEEVQTQSTQGEDGEIEEEDDDGTGN